MSSTSGGAGPECRSQFLDLGRSVIRLSWAMTVFGAQQTANLVTQAGSAGSRSTAAAAFDAVTNAVEGQVGGAFRSAYKTGRGFMLGLGRQEPEVADTTG